MGTVMGSQGALLGPDSPTFTMQYYIGYIRFIPGTCYLNIVYSNVIEALLVILTNQCQSK